MPSRSLCTYAHRSRCVCVRVGQVLATFPLQLYPAADLFHRAIPTRYGGRHGRVAQRIANVLVVGLCVALVCSLPSLGSLIDLIGALTNTSIAAVPCAIHMRLLTTPHLLPALRQHATRRHKEAQVAEPSPCERPLAESSLGERGDGCGDRRSDECDDRRGDGRGDRRGDRRGDERIGDGRTGSCGSDGGGGSFSSTATPLVAPPAQSYRKSGGMGAGAATGTLESCSLPMAAGAEVGVSADAERAMAATPATPADGSEGNEATKAAEAAEGALQSFQLVGDGASPLGRALMLLVDGVIIAFCIAVAAAGAEQAVRDLVLTPSTSVILASRRAR